MEGELPAGWETRTIASVADVTGGLTKNASLRDRSVEVAPLVTVAAVGWRVVRGEDLTTIGVLPGDGDKARLQKEDILLVEGNGSPSQIGRVALWDLDVPNARHQNHLIRLRAKADVAPRYLLEWLLSPDGREALVAAATSATGLFNLSISKVCALELPLPPIDDQKRIVARLDELLARVRRAREALADVPRVIDQLRRSVLAAAFRGELTASWRAAHPDVEPASALLGRLRAERRARWEAANPKKKYAPPEPVDPDAEDLPELPEGWVWARLEELAANESASITDGPFGSKLKSEHYSESGVRVIRLGNIGVGEFIDHVQAFIPVERLVELRKHEVFGGDLLIAALADPVGRSCELPPGLGQAIVKADCIRFKVAPSLERRLVMHWLNSPSGRAQSAAVAHGVGRVRMNMEEIRALAVPVMPPEEAVVLQQIIAERLESIATMEQIHRASNGQLPRIEQALLARAFRGEL